jgi:dipeptidyl aminopeptidase/acylaminoacyl peptidase
MPNSEGRPIFAKAARRVLAWIAVLGVTGLLLRISGCADRAFFHPSRDSPIAPPGVEEVTFKTSDGLRLHGWLLKPRSVPGQRFPVVIHCHGNAGNVENHAPFSEFLVDDGFAVLMFDYRGYGDSENASSTRATLVRDTQAALDYALLREDLDPHRIGVLGVSLGGVAASHLAADRPEIRSVALISPFTGWSDIADDHVPVLGRLLVRRGFDPMDAAVLLGTKPLLVMHGERDTVVPVAHGRRLVEAALSAGVGAQLFLLPGADHNDVMDGRIAREELARFFSQTLDSAR